MSELKHAGSEITGFGSHSAAEVEQLQKALGLGGQGGIDGNVAGGFAGNPFGSYITETPGQFTAGNALAVEDLDRTLKLVTFGLEHLRLWKDILKERVPQVVHEYNIQNAYGVSDTSPFFQMGATPAETDASYNRDVVEIKYLGTKGAVLHNLTLIQAAHGPVVAREVKNKTIELLARNERALFDADSAIGLLEYDGLYKQILGKSMIGEFISSAFASYGDSANEVPLINANGADFDEDIAEDAALVAVNNFGMPMDMYLGTDVHSSFSRAFYAKQRTVPGESLTSGNRVTEHMGTLDYRFKPSLFNRPRKGVLVAPISAAGTGSGANLGFTLTINGAGVANDILVAPVTAAGEQVGRAIQGDAANIVIASDVAAADILYFNTYSRVTSSTLTEIAGYLFIGRASKVAQSAPAFVVRANAEFVGLRNNAAATNSPSFVEQPRTPGSAKAYLLMHDPDVLCWKQLGSMIKYDLAVTTTQYEWLQLLYGTPLVMAPRKNVLIENLRSEARA